MMLSRKKMLLQFVSKNKPIIAVALFAAFLSSLCSVLLPLSIGSFYQIAFKETGGKNELLERLGVTMDSLASFFWFFAALTMLKGILTWVEHVSMRSLEERITYDVRNRLFQAQMNHDFDAFHTRSAGKYLARYSSDMLAIQHFVSKGIIKPIADGLFLIAAFLLLFQLNGSLSNALLIVFITGSLLMILISSLQKKPNETRRSARSSLLGFIEQRLHAISTIKVFNRAHPEELKFVKRNKKLYDSSIQFQLYNGLNKALPQLIFFSAIGILLFLSIQTDSEQRTTSSSVLIFILILLYLQSVYKRLLRVPSIRSSGAASFENLMSVLNLPHEVMHTHIEKKDLQKNLSLQLHNLSFHYSSEHHIIHNLNADFHVGQVCRIDGAAGSGKTTLFRLLLKLHRVERGHIFIAEHDINDIGAHDLRKVMTIVSDDYPLLGSTIFEAISYSRKDAKRPLVAEVLIQLGLTTSQEAEYYLDRRIHTAGADLSSAERRMLQFARALLTKKSIILLDEPFIGLNTSNLQVVCDKLNNLKSSSIILIIAKEIPQEISIDKQLKL
jgi:ABC-type multidrug transport system fused ATPase/permease subunit